MTLWVLYTGPMELFDGYPGTCSDVMLYSEDVVYLVWVPDA